MTEAECRLWATFKEEGDPSAREQLILSYMGFTRGVALQCGAAFACDSVEEAIAEAYVALIECVDRFDPARGFTFITMASKRIKGAVIDLARKAAGLLWSRSGPSVEVTPFSECECSAEGLVEDTLLAGDPSPEDTLVAKEDSKALGGFLVELPTNWKCVLLLRVFGKKSPAAIAEAMGFSYHRAVQITALIKQRFLARWRSTAGSAPDL